jgi:hypothetical protein
VVVNAKYAARFKRHHPHAALRPCIPEISGPRSIAAAGTILTPFVSLGGAHDLILFPASAVTNQIRPRPLETRCRAHSLLELFCHVYDNSPHDRSQAKEELKPAYGERSYFRLDNIY